jgi:glycine/D-amino acid oxidase-like deaminating enzyme
MRPATPDELPVIGPDPLVDGVVHASGHYRNGVLLAPITARLVADWIVNGRRDPAFEMFSSARFGD